MYYEKDHSGATVAIYTYSSSGAAHNNTRLYTGREYDTETALYYNRARYYSPTLGRFISRDPIGIQDDVNLYAYTGNNPVNGTDRMGLSGKKILSENEQQFVDYTHTTETIIDWISLAATPFLFFPATAPVAAWVIEVGSIVNFWLWAGETIMTWEAKPVIIQWAWLFIPKIVSKGLKSLGVVWKFSYDASNGYIKELTTGAEKIYKRPTTVAKAWSAINEWINWVVSKATTSLLEKILPSNWWF